MMQYHFCFWFVFLSNCMNPSLKQLIKKNCWGREISRWTPTKSLIISSWTSLMSTWTTASEASDLRQKKMSGSCIQISRFYRVPCRATSDQSKSANVRAHALCGMSARRRSSALKPSGRRNCHSYSASDQCLILWWLIGKHQQQSFSHVLQCRLQQHHLEGSTSVHHSLLSQKVKWPGNSRRNVMGFSWTENLCNLWISSLQQESLAQYICLRLTWF